MGLALRVTIRDTVRGAVSHPPGPSGSGGSPGAVSVPSDGGREEEEDEEEDWWVRGWGAELGVPHGVPRPGSSAMCRSSAGREPWLAAAPRKG